MRAHGDTLRFCDRPEITKYPVHVLILSNFANPDTITNADVYGENVILGNFEGCKVAQIEDVYEGFSDFWSILRSIHFTHVGLSHMV